MLTISGGASCLVAYCCSCPESRTGLQICLVDGTAYDELVESTPDGVEPDVRSSMKLRNKEVKCFAFLNLNCSLTSLACDNKILIRPEAWQVNATQLRKSSFQIWLCQQLIGRGLIVRVPLPLLKLPSLEIRLSCRERRSAVGIEVRLKCCQGT